MAETKTYKTKSGIYDIPDTDIQDFLKDFPDAVETEAFTVGKDTFDIPITERDAFLKDMPTAQPIQKKKDLSLQDTFTSASGKEELPFLGQSGRDITRPLPSTSEDAYTALTEANVTKTHKTGEPVTAENYITAAPQAYNKRMGEAIRNVAEIIALPKNTLSYYINKFGGKNKETSQAFLEQAFSNIPLLGGVFDKEKVNTIASAIENAGNPKEIPQNVAGSVLSTLGSIAFDISTVRTMPTSKLNILAKHGMERVPVFPSYLGIMQGTTTAREGGDIKETGLATTEGIAAGLTYEGMGVTAGRVGKLVKDLGANNVTSTSARALANSALFEGDSRLKGGEKWTGAITGFVFAFPEYAGDARRAVAESMAKRAYVSYLTTTDNAIKIISEMNIDPKIERAKSDELWKQIEKETDPVKKQALIEEKTTVDNIINVNAISKAIIENPQPFIKQIDNDPRLSEAEKQQWKDKIGKTVREADPRIKEAQPTLDKINNLTEQLNGLASLYTEPTIRAEKAAVIEGKIKELRKGVTEILNRPLQDVPKYELNGKPIEKIDAMNMIAKAEKAEDLEGLKVSNDEDIQRSIEKRFGLRVPQNDLAIGKDVFKSKAELFKHLDEVAVDKEGQLDKAWFDREMDSWPSEETVKAINEWTEKKQKEIKSKQAPQEVRETETTEVEKPLAGVEHKQNIETKFREVFTKKGIPKEQVEGAVALMEARANAWASEEKGRKAEDWYERIADVKEGEFQKDTPRLYQLPDGRQVMGLADVETTNGFYSPIEKRLTEFKQEKASVNKWKEIIGKRDEAQFTGVLDWLNSMKPDQSLTKAEINQFMKDNRIEVVEVQKGKVNLSDEAVFEEAGFVIKKKVDDGAAYVYPYNVYTKEGEYVQEVKSPESAPSEPQIRNMGRQIVAKNKGGSQITKFESYQLAGEKENYKEVLVTLPAEELSIEERLIRGGWKIVKTSKVGGNAWEIYDDFGAFIAKGKTKDEATYSVPREKIPVKFNEKNFSSGHFDEPNILVHLRMNTRTDSEGKKVLFIEEVQSDWGQRGKKEGFSEPSQKVDIRINENADKLHQVEVYDVNTGKTISAWAGRVAAEAEKILIEKKQISGTPLGPFVTDTNAWVKLGLKVALKEAVKQGADRIAWTTGEQQAERYKESLVKEIDEIEVTQKSLQDVTSTRGITFMPKDGRDGFYVETNPEGIITYETNTTALGKMKGKPLSEVVGKDAAEDIMGRPEETTFKPKDIVVRGLGMKGFYGTPSEGKLGIVGNVARKVFGQEPNTTVVNKVIAKQDVVNKYNIDSYAQKRFGKNYADIQLEADRLDVLLDAKKDGVNTGSFNKEYTDALRSYIPESQQHSIDITPELKAEVEKGLPLFQKGKGKPQGALETLEDGKVIIHALSQPNFSTMVHEIGHIFEKDLNPQEVSTLETWSGAKSGTTKFKEAFARATERYLRDGVAPTKALKPIFEKFKQWLTGIYSKLRGSPIEKKLSPQVKEVFNRLLTEKPPIETITEKKDKSDTNIPPEGDKPVEGSSGGDKGKIRTILERALNSDLPEDVKQQLREEGVEYVPRGRKVTEKEAEELVRVFDAEENGMEKLQAAVRDLSNGILPDTRTMLNAMLAERYIGKLEGITDAKERAPLIDKLTDALIFEAEQGTIGGQSVEAKKRWGRVFGTTPEIIVASMRERFDRENRAYFADKVTEVEFVKSAIEEYVKSGDFKAKIEQGIGAEIDKLGTKNWGKESKKKIDDFFSKLLIDPKQQNLYGGMLGIPVAMYNGSLLAVKNALLLGVDLATAIQRGVDYLDKEYKDKFEKGTIESPDWGRDEYIADTNERLKALRQQIPTVDKPTKATKPKKVKAPPSQEELVDKLFVKMSKIATRKQIGKFVMDYMQEIADKGVITDPRFRAILAKALGRDYVTEQTEAKITKAARTLGSANKKAEEYAKSVQDILDEYQKEPKTEEDKINQKQALRDLEKKAKEAKKIWDKSVFGAEKANQEIKEILVEQPDLLARIGTLIQGNLLVPGSQLANIFGNLLILPYTAPAYLVSGAADAMRAGGSSVLEKALSKIDPIKYPDLYHWTNKHISTERTILPFTYARGYVESVMPSVGKGLKQLFTGALSSDLSKFNVQRGVHPIKALKDFVSRDRKWQDRIGDLLEAAPAGYFAEAQFRLLNLGDKPFRGGAEGGRLGELFELDYRKKIKEAKAIEDAIERKKRIKYLESTKKTARKKFMAQPDSEALVEARKSGDIATFAQNTPLSEWVSSFEKKFMPKDDNTTTAIGNSFARLVKMTNIPYVKIPINLTMLGIEASAPPISAVKLLKHTYDGNTRAAMDDIGRLAISAALTSVSLTFARYGIITTLSDDKDVRAAQLEAGVEAGRFNVSAAWRLATGKDPTFQEGDRLRSIKRLGVASIQMMSIAEAYKNKTPEDIAKMQEQPFRSYISSMADALPYMPKIALEQSILMGANTLIQAALGGEAEKDRWATSQATVLSTVLYPSTVAAISQATDPEGFLRETRDLSLDDGKIKRHIINIFKDRMFMGKNLPAKVSLWGEPVLRIPEGEKWSYHLFGIMKEKKYQKYSFGTRLYEIFKEYEKQDPEEAKKIFPTLPSYSTKVGWEDSKMTPFELQAYQMRVGTIRAQEAEAYVNSTDWEDATLEEKNRELSRIYLKARKEAEAEMFSWEDFKASEPIKEHQEQWDIIANSEAIPLPSMVRTVKSGSKTYRLEDSDIKELNMIAFYKYAEKILPYLEENKNNLDVLKEYNKRTGSSRFIDRLNNKWRESLDFAKREMARRKRNE